MLRVHPGTGSHGPASKRRAVIRSIGALTTVFSGGQPLPMSRRVSIDGNLFHQTEITHRGEREERTDPVEGRGSLTVSDDGLEWVIRAGLRGGGQERASGRISWWTIKQLMRKGSYTLLGYEDMATGSLDVSTVRGTLRFENRSNDDAAQIELAAREHLDIAYWEPDPQDAGWESWWWEGWIKQERWLKNVVWHSPFQEGWDEYYLWYRASVGLWRNQKLARKAISAYTNLHERNHAWWKAIDDEGDQESLAADAREAWSVLMEVRRTWMSEDAFAERKDFGFGDWLDRNFTGFLNVYKASLEATGQVQKLAQDACQAFHSYCEKCVLGETAEAELARKKWVASLDAWDGAHPKAHREWLDETERIRAANDRGVELGLAWFGAYSHSDDDPSFSFSLNEKAKVPPVVQAHYGLPNGVHDEVESIRIGCTLPVELADARLVLKLEDIEPVSRELGERTFFSVTGKEYIFSGTNFDFEASEHEAPTTFSIRLFLNGEWIAEEHQFDETDWR